MVGCGRFPNSFPGSYEVLDDEEDELDELVIVIMVSRWIEQRDREEIGRMPCHNSSLSGR
ncbi:OLC1v1030734C1 [Oldenlandia corymbosa var. corymbosa]|uniref:OLC1v1030734C1 n=1 Tax=Oldenlandia corymbosa var. corymbosa TaxID=529605 RepID=A0AAV1CGV1_OLDCO|nr:OLC1v1030734C1 [Oldenlandia corymbosa var. corymbosa]